MRRLQINSVTFDTNVFPAEPLVGRARRLGMVVATTSVSRREVEGSSLEEEIRAFELVVEGMVFGESRWGEAMLTKPEESACLERMLALLSNGAFPARGRRDDLSHGQRRQLRDAMILCAHVRERRDLFVSNDRRAFVDGGRRKAIEGELGIRVMTVAEFEAYLSERERNLAS
jgi:hypothetical protein